MVKGLPFSYTPPTALPAPHSLKMWAVQPVRASVAGLADTVLPVDSSGAPPGSKVITAGLAIDTSRGDIWFNGSRIPVIPAVISAVVVKGILFGGAMAGQYARGAMAKKFGKPATA